ncbi:MAG: 16S rRNA (guanine(527)-N(7))-methyltransferase RsmG [Oscillospiraceae bacterium]|nr:16S rRNA (guanine(527)-N(7))-methyltransferase RsmG [Oscillospiraceae bacterium]
MLKALQEGKPQLGLTIDDATAEKLCAFGEAVVEQNKVMNLTAITEPEKVAKLHLLDSLTVLKGLDLSGKKVIDVGCGAGFPGVPLKIACPTMELTLLDSLGKRMKWLETVLPELGVEALCLTARAEEAVATRRESYDVATSRAVARLNVLLELTAPYVKVGGFVAAMKGTAAEEELQESKNAIAQLGLKLEKVLQFPMDDTNHTLILLKKVKPTPPRYPRKFAKIKQSPL